MIMRKIFFVSMLLVTGLAKAQLTVNILVPPSGIMDKQQLWNIIATNTETTPLTIQVQVTFAEVNTGQPVFVASSSPIVIGAGTSQLTSNSIGAVQYNIVNPDYQMDPGPSGLLPVGTFSVCYNFLINKYDKVIQECQQINIPPLGPLLLSQPANGSELQQYNPLFSWLPPSPVNALNNLRYDFRLVEVMQGQTGADAIKDNLPVFNTSGITATNYPYTNNTPIESGKQYAWQIVALNNLTVISKSEVWTFYTKETTTENSLRKAGGSYIKLKKEGSADGSAVFWKNIRFDYFNETTDTTWRVTVADLTGSNHPVFDLSLENISLKRGQNLVSYDAGRDKKFIDKHQYLLRVTNLRGEVWQVRFEYRKSENE
jgi:hypothetical protein